MQHFTIDQLQTRLEEMEEQNPSRNNYPLSGREQKYFARGGTLRSPPSIKDQIDRDKPTELLKATWEQLERSLAVYDITKDERTLDFACFCYREIERKLKERQWCLSLFELAIENGITHSGYDNTILERLKQ